MIQQHPQGEYPCFIYINIKNMLQSKKYAAVKRLYSCSSKLGSNLTTIWDNSGETFVIIISTLLIQTRVWNKWTVSSALGKFSGKGTQPIDNTKRCIMLFMSTSGLLNVQATFRNKQQNCLNGVTLANKDKAEVWIHPHITFHFSWLWEKER